MSLVFWILILNLLFLKSTSLQAGSRTVLREIIDYNGGGNDPKDYTVELNGINFDSVLKDIPATYAIVEFFAHWCPACRNYKPQYERVARLFNGPRAVHPGLILMARIDCGYKINNQFCDKFSVHHYPMLFWGHPTEFSAGWDPEKAKSNLRVIEDDWRTAELLLNWINKQIGSSYGLDDEKFENEHLLPNLSSDPGQIARAVFDVEEATTTAFDIILEHKIFCRGSKNDTRGFSCGLWVLMHSLSVRIEDGESQSAFTSLCDFIQNFFICEECDNIFMRCVQVSKVLSKKPVTLSA